MPFFSSGKNKGFEGLIDEVAVWNRALPAALIPTVMFAMPGYLPELQLEATGGEQKDYTLGRVLYARFQVRFPLPATWDQRDEGRGVLGYRFAVKAHPYC